MTRRHRSGVRLRLLEESGKELVSSQLACAQESDRDLSRSQEDTHPRVRLAGLRSQEHRDIPRPTATFHDCLLWLSSAQRMRPALSSTRENMEFQLLISGRCPYQVDRVVESRSWSYNVTVGRGMSQCRGSPRPILATVGNI